jgi:hypothetical protein
MSFCILDVLNNHQQEVTDNLLLSLAAALSVDRSGDACGWKRPRAKTLLSTPARQGVVSLWQRG